MLSDVRECRELVGQGRSNELLEVDCRVHSETIGDIVKAGADIFVSGSAIFQDSDYI
jgi:ribulose-phosphate 3-epimerase